MAMECSVTVSMGDDSRGVFNDILLVTGVSSATSEAGKPREAINKKCQADRELKTSTDIAGQHQKVIVGKAAMSLGI